MAFDSRNSQSETALEDEPQKQLQKRPKRWKQFLITVACVYPLTVVIPITLTCYCTFLRLSGCP
jgi:antibiotic biosynthesis monooxygenase (ABM) superfamily enzyme